MTEKLRGLPIPEFCKVLNDITMKDRQLLIKYLEEKGILKK